MSPRPSSTLVNVTLQSGETLFGKSVSYIQVQATNDTDFVNTEDHFALHMAFKKSLLLLCRGNLK